MSTEQVLKCDEATKLRDGWQVVLFDQMAECITDRIDNPAEAGVEYYVGLEHLDSESLKIRRWGIPTDVEATKLRFKPGDIIFGKRRAYQRKVAIAEFEGICSAHALVLRAREETVLKDFLPFLMQSNAFFERAMAISVGSLSPTINWKTLARQEFALPPKDEQRRIADILWAVDETSMSWQTVFNSLAKIRQAYLDVLFDGAQSQAVSYEGTWTLKRLDELAIIQTGLAKGKDYGNEPIVSRPYLRVANVQDGYLDLSEMKEIAVAVKDIERYSLEVGDVLLTEGGDFDKLGRGTVWRGEIDGCLHQNHIFCVRPDTNKVLPEFLSLQTGSRYGKQYFLSCSKQTTNLASINASQVKAFPVLLPPIEEQKRIIDYFTATDSYIGEVNKHIVQTSQLKRKLLISLLMPNQ